MPAENAITLYTAQTPNGVKVSILLEELGLKYKTVKVSIKDGDQKQPWFLAINPNGRIPALTDKLDGKTVRLFESGSILQYLVDEYDKDHKVSFPRGTEEYYEVNSWLFFQNAGVGPMQGQANHFARYAPEHIQYGVDRYKNETRRLYGVLEKHLKDGNREYLVGNRCTIADISHFGWVEAAGWPGIDINDFPTLKAWQERMLARPGVAKGRDVPGPSPLLNITEEEKEKLAAESRAWIQKDMKEFAAKK